jgi:hypothetical protein
MLEEHAESLLPRVLLFTLRIFMKRLHNTAVWYLARGDLIAWFSHPSRSSIRPLHYDIQSRTSLGTGSEASSNMIPLLLEANY